jgi:hypothetical protein
MSLLDAAVGVGSFAAFFVGGWLFLSSSLLKGAGEDAELSVQVRGALMITEQSRWARSVGKIKKPTLTPNSPPIHNTSPTTNRSSGPPLSPSAATSCSSWSTKRTK